MPRRRESTFSLVVLSFVFYILSIDAQETVFTLYTTANCTSSKAQNFTPTASGSFSIQAQGLPVLSVKVLQFAPGCTATIYSDPYCRDDATDADYWRCASYGGRQIQSLSTDLCDVALPNPDAWPTSPNAFLSTISSSEARTLTGSPKYLVSSQQSSSSILASLTNHPPQETSESSAFDGATLQPTKMPDIQTGSSQTLAPSSDILSTAGTSTTDNANSDNSGRYANASNLSTIIGTAVGIPVGLLTVIVTVYFGCKELRTKMRRDQRGSELSLVSVHGHS